jgi:hypothetical protein
MMKSGIALVVLASLVSIPTIVRSQDVAAVVARARNGEVRVSFSPRDGVCGDGADMIIADHKRYLYPETETYGTFPRERMCIDGGVRVSIRKEGGTVVAIRTYAGGAWERSTHDVTDAGAISQSSAMNFFLGIASSSRDESVAAGAVMPGSLATLSGLIPRLRDLARDRSRPEAVRVHALNWIGQTGGDEARDVLERIAYDDSMPIAVRSRALKGLWEMRAMNSLVEFAESSEPSELRKTAISWLEQKSHKTRK